MTDQHGQYTHIVTKLHVRPASEQDITRVPQGSVEGPTLFKMLRFTSTIYLFEKQIYCGGFIYFPCIYNPLFI